MKKIGLIGGISWTSTIDYYKYINVGVNEKFGGLNFAECVIYSVNFGKIQELSWDKSYEILYRAYESLKKAGAEGIALCANTAHMYADRLEATIHLPLINIINETAKIITQKGFKKIGLLGTKFTMEMDFYIQKLESFGIEVLIPESSETRDYIQSTLRDELGVGIINPATKEKYKEIIAELINNGAECIVLGCTEIPLLITQEDLEIPVLDTTKIHSQAIVDFITS